MSRKVVSYEIVDHGIDHEQYFQGCGVAYTIYDVCFTGIGDDPHEALDDALEQAAMSGLDVDKIKNKEKHSPSVSNLVEQASEDECFDEHHYYSSIRLKLGPRFKVNEYSTGFQVEDTETGQTHWLGDGVDTLFTKSGKAMKPGSAYFRRTWEKALNETESETLAAYFPKEV